MSEYYSIESLNEIAEDDQEFLVTLASTFLEEIPLDVEKMVEAIENGNRKLAYQFAHKLKPNLEMFGTHLESDITAIETWTRTAKNCSSITNNIENVTKRVELALIELKKDFNL